MSFYLSALNPVLRWNSAGSTIAGITSSPGSNTNQFNLPIDVALGLSNSLYITDYYNHRLQKWIIGASSGTTIAGQANASLGSTSAYLNHPTGIYVDSNDNIYVADSFNARVQLWSNGAFTGTLVAGNGKPQRKFIHTYKYS